MSIVIITEVICDGCSDHIRTRGPEADPIGTLARARAMGWEGSIDEILCPECSGAPLMINPVEYFECEVGHRITLTSEEIQATGNGGVDLRCGTPTGKETSCDGRLKVLIHWR